jgi:hypothetical protein
METEVSNKIINEAKRIEEDSIHSAKGHYNAAAFWRKFNLIIGLPATIMATVAGASSLGEFNNHAFIAAVLALLVAALSAVTTFINPNEKAISHSKSGNLYNALKNDTRIFREIDFTHLSETEIRAMLHKLNDRRNDLNIKSPAIPTWAFLLAKHGIKDGEAEYQVDQ